jgi:hypothetical protein
MLVALPVAVGGISGSPHMSIVPAVKYSNQTAQ